MGCRSVREVLERGALATLHALLDGSDPDLDLADVRLHPPVVDSRKILCAGLNYHAHVTEAETVSSGVTAPHPTIFSRFPDTQVGHEAGIVKPSVSEQFDYEGELAVIIGQPIFRAAPSAATRTIAGYAVYNDGSARDWQMKSSQWQPGKNFPRSGALGPALVTVEEVPDIERQMLTTRVNGEVRQQAKINDLIYGIPELLSYISQFAPLWPGDVIVTGTPAGAGMFQTPPAFLQVGDVVEVEITNVGLLRNEVIPDDVAD